MNNDLPPQQNRLASQEREHELHRRQRASDRRRMLGLIAIALFILALAFLRFGRHIPWGAR